ncbi:hypothetical protein, partial [uncultured Thiodictyon sp.]|uniref:hypothetical protein n=1 Tax=uncultured Thiodictyon sp. TaxID=1846217 RepID=UPI0026005464
RCPQAQRRFIQATGKRPILFFDYLGNIHAPSVTAIHVLFKLFLLGSLAKVGIGGCVLCSGWFGC